MPGTDHTIEDVEIFSTGVWNGEVYELSDLKEIVANFNTLKGSIDPPLKFGHDKEQELTGEGEKNLIGQNDGDMALGWVESLKIKGNRLLATFTGVPEIVYQAMKRRRYSKISAEIFFKITHKGKEIGKALRAVSLLGADLPAVTDLEDLAVFLTENKIPSSLLTVGGRSITLSSTDNDLTSHVTILTPMKEQKMSEETKDFSFDDRKELNNLREFKQKQEIEMKSFKDKARIVEFSLKRDSILKTLDIEVVKGNVTPILREEFNQAITEQIGTYTLGGSLFVPAEKIAEMISKYSEKLPLREEGKDKEEEKETSSNPSEAFSAAIKDIQAEKSLSYSEASNVAKISHPDLFKNYTDYIAQSKLRVN